MTRLLTVVCVLACLSIVTTHTLIGYAMHEECSPHWIMIYTTAIYVDKKCYHSFLCRIVVYICFITQAFTHDRQTLGACIHAIKHNNRTRKTESNSVRLSHCHSQWPLNVNKRHSILFILPTSVEWLNKKKINERKQYYCTYIWNDPMWLCHFSCVIMQIVCDKIRTSAICWFQYKWLVIHHKFASLQWAGEDHHLVWHWSKSSFALFHGLLPRNTTAGGVTNKTVNYTSLAPLNWTKRPKFVHCVLHSFQ